MAGAAGYFGHPRLVVANQDGGEGGNGGEEAGASHWTTGGGEKAGLVHLDGGRAQREQEENHSGPSSGAQQPDAPPPAYSAD